MALSTTTSLARMAFRIAGSRAPLVLARYAALTYLNRTSRRRPIRKVPHRAAAQATPQDDQTAYWDADIVVPVYNDFEGLQGLLTVLRAEAAQFSSVILVHDCSTDARILPLLRSFSEAMPNAALIENDRNLGFLQTCNRGLRTSKNDAIILNTDIELPPGALGRLVDVLRGADDIATVTPFSSSAYGAGFPDLNYDNARPFGATTAQIDSAFQEAGPWEPIEIPRGVGFCMAMSRKAVEKIGAFDEGFGQGYGEEADFCLRARSAELRNVLAPNVYVHHKAGQSFGGSSQQKARAGLIRLLDRHPDYPALVRRYLEDGEARAVSFVALVALLQRVSGHPISIAAEPASSQQSPLLDVDRNGLTAELRGEGGSYDFAFANSAIANEVLDLAGLNGRRVP
jgi:GT2 family glycosyltransferase